MVVVVGISFNLIIIRVDQTANDINSSLAESANPRSYPLHFMRSSISRTPTSRGLEVMISRNIDTVSDPGKHESITAKPDERSEWTDL